MVSSGYVDLVFACRFVVALVWCLVACSVFGVWRLFGYGFSTC